MFVCKVTIEGLDASATTIAAAAAGGPSPSSPSSPGPQWWVQVTPATAVAVPYDSGATPHPLPPLPSHPPPSLRCFHPHKHYRHSYFHDHHFLITLNPFLDGSMSRPPLAWSAVALAPSATITSACICSHPPHIIVASCCRIGIHSYTLPCDNTFSLSRTSHTHCCCGVRDSHCDFDLKCLAGIIPISGSFLKATSRLDLPFDVFALSCASICGGRKGVAVAAMSIMSRDVHTLIIPHASSSSSASSGHVISHAHHDNLSDAAIHDLCLMDVEWGVLMMLGLVDGTCSVFSLPDVPQLSPSSSATIRPILLRRIAVGYPVSHPPTHSLSFSSSSPPSCQCCSCYYALPLPLIQPRNIAASLKVMCSIATASPACDHDDDSFAFVLKFKYFPARSVLSSCACSNTLLSSRSLEISSSSSSSSSSRVLPILLFSSTDLLLTLPLNPSLSSSNCHSTAVDPLAYALHEMHVIPSSRVTQSTSSSYAATKHSEVASLARLPRERSVLVRCSRLPNWQFGCVVFLV